MHLAWKSTLYVTNFPESADDAFIRNLFGSVSSLFPIEFRFRTYSFLVVWDIVRRSVAEQKVQDDAALLLCAVHFPGVYWVVLPFCRIGLTETT